MENSHGKMTSRSINLKPKNRRKTTIERKSEIGNELEQLDKNSKDIRTFRLKI